MTSKDVPHDAPDRDRPAKTEEPAAPPVVEYPKMLYHADGSTKTVASQEEEAAATKDGYQDKPVEPEAPSPKRRA